MQSGALGADARQFLPCGIQVGARGGEACLGYLLLLMFCAGALLAYCMRLQ